MVARVRRQLGCGQGPAGCVQGADLRERACVGNRLTIAEVRARRSDPVWRRRHKVADITGAFLVVLLLALHVVGVLLWRPVGAAMLLALLVAGPAAIWSGGPRVGFERRAALLAGAPVLNLAVLVLAVWRAAHLHLQRWHGPLEPRWDDTVWTGAGIAAGLCWVAGIVVAVLTLLSG
jgi:hypothetical protein